MSRRPPSTPPEIPGFEYVRLLGSGGFADVFLYQELHPHRQVAIKVMLKERMTPDSAESFTTEANVMAQLTGHPSIVDIYQAGVAADGRPYLVMEYCSRPNLQVRHRQERFSEAETLRIGVQIASAVEAAHRVGILHRDIKPANILVTAYNRPALTDFGISADVESQMSGMSIPWSPPEAFASPPRGYPASDVYSLAATLYTLLTNRSPFQLPGSPNGEIDVIQRIQTMEMPPLGRPDVSAAFESVLRRAMAKAPEDRYPSAVEFARALQRVQIELGMSTTQIDLIEEEIDYGPGDDDDDATVFRDIHTIDAQSTIEVPRTPAPAPLYEDLDDHTIQQRPVEDHTIRRQQPVDDDTIHQQRPLDDQTIMQQPVAPLIDGSSDISGLAATAPPATAPPDPHPAAHPPAHPSAHPSVPPSAQTAAVAHMDTTRPPAAPAADPRTPEPRRRSPLAMIIAGVAVLAVVGAGIGYSVFSGKEPAEETIQNTPTSEPVSAVEEDFVPRVTNLRGSIKDGVATFTWDNPDPQEGDTYLWRTVTVTSTGEFAPVEDTTVEVKAGADEVCIEVVLRRSNGTAAVDGAKECTS